MEENFIKDLKNEFDSKTVLVTGGAGFIGSWICETLLKNNARVYCLDDFSTGLLENVLELKNEKNFTLLNQDVTRDLEINEKLDMILHLASRPSPEDYVKFPINTLDANSKGTKNMLELARKNDGILLFSSTSEIYGDAKIIPTNENYWGNVNSTGIRSCYDEGKRFSEALLMAYHREYGLDTKIVRIFNTYGPRIRSDGAYGRALPRFILQALQNKDITIYGDGFQTRSFCYISDTVKAVLKCILNDNTNAIPVNVGNPNEITIKELAEIILKKTNSKSEIKFLERPEDDPQRRCPDIKLAYSLLNWKPIVDLEEGLEKTISWMQKKLNI